MQLQIHAGIKVKPFKSASLYNPLSNQGRFSRSCNWYAQRYQNKVIDTIVDITLVGLFSS